MIGRDGWKKKENEPSKQNYPLKKSVLQVKHIKIKDLTN